MLAKALLVEGGLLADSGSGDGENGGEQKGFADHDVTPLAGMKY